MLLNLKDVDAIALLVETSFSFDAHRSTFSLDMFTDLGDEEFDSVWRFHTHCKIINLQANQHVLSINSARRIIPLMNGAQKSHLVNKVSVMRHSHRTPASGCPWRARQRGLCACSTYYLTCRDTNCRGHHELPRNSQLKVWWGLLVGVFNVTKGNVMPSIEACSNECPNMEIQFSWGKFMPAFVTRGQHAWNHQCRHAICTHHLLSPALSTQDGRLGTVS